MARQPTGAGTVGNAGIFTSGLVGFGTKGVVGAGLDFRHNSLARILILGLKMVVAV